MILRQSRILDLARPRDRVVTVLRKWFRRNKIPTLFEEDAKLFNDIQDLIALHPAQAQDRLSWFLCQFGYFFRYKDRGDIPESWGDIQYFPETRVAKSVKIISTLVATALLVGAITSLYFVKPLGIKLGLLCLYTILFAASLSLLTNARQAEVFGASAA